MKAFSDILKESSMIHNIPGVDDLVTDILYDVSDCTEGGYHPRIRKQLHDTIQKWLKEQDCKRCTDCNYPLDDDSEDDLCESCRYERDRD